MADTSLTIDTGLKGYQDTTAMIEDVASKQDLKRAYAESGTDPKTGDANDMFRVNSLAAQMAASRGDTRSADKFQKQANDQKKDMLSIQEKEISLNQEKLEEAERNVHSMTNAKDAMDSLMKSNLPIQQKMQWANQLRQLGDDPEAFKAFKERMQEGVMKAKDRLTAEQKTLKMQQDYALKQEGLDIKRDQVRNMALYQQGMLSMKEFMAGLAQDKLIKDYDTTIDKKQEHLKDLRVKREKGGLTDEEKAAQATDEANTNEEIRQLRKKQDAIKRGEKSTPSKAKSEKTVEAKTQSDIDNLKPGTRFVWTDGQTYIKE